MSFPPLCLSAVQRKKVKAAAEIAVNVTDVNNGIFKIIRTMNHRQMTVVFLHVFEKKGGKVSDSLKKFKEQGYKNSEQLEELIADSLFKAYDSDFIRDLAKNDKDVAEAPGDNLDKMIASIEAGIQSLGQSGNHKEIEALNDDLEGYSADIP